MRNIESALSVSDDLKFKAACELYKELSDDMTDFSGRHIKFGFDLIRFEKDRLYSAIKPVNANFFSLVYSNIYEFCEAEFGMKKRAAANHIAVARRFADKDGKVLEKYKDYRFSQLVVMLDTKEFLVPVQDYFKPDLKVEDMKKLVKAVKKGTFDLGKDVVWNVNRINETLEAEKAGKAEQVRANIESVEEKYESEDKITADGEFIAGQKEEVHINALPEVSEVKKRIKRVFREKGYTFQVNGKTVTAETVIGNIIKELYKE